MPRVIDDRNRDRLKAIIGVAVFHAALGYLLITGLASRAVGDVTVALKVFDVREPLPPPLPEDAVPAERTAEAEGAAAPPNLRANPSPIVAPPPRIRLEVPPPVVTAPITSPAPGADTSAGAADIPGPGTGSGGVGSGTGSGGQGTGGGSGGAAAQRVSGGLRNEDYPRSALRARAQGAVTVRFTIEVNGRVSRCTITRSSGNADLDSTTCKLLERRLRYRPARNAAGRPVASTETTTFEWAIPPR